MRIVTHLQKIRMPVNAASCQNGVFVKFYLSLFSTCLLVASSGLAAVHVPPFKGAQCHELNDDSAVQFENRTITAALVQSGQFPVYQTQLSGSISYNLVIDYLSNGTPLLRGVAGYDVSFDLPLDGSKEKNQKNAEATSSHSSDFFDLHCDYNF